MRSSHTTEWVPKAVFCFHMGLCRLPKHSWRQRRIIPALHNKPFLCMQSVARADQLRARGSKPQPPPAQIHRGQQLLDHQPNNLPMQCFDMTLSGSQSFFVLLCAFLQALPTLLTTKAATFMPQSTRPAPHNFVGYQPLPSTYMQIQAA